MTSSTSLFLRLRHHKLKRANVTMSSNSCSTPRDLRDGYLPVPVYSAVSATLKFSVGSSNSRVGGGYEGCLR